MPYPEGFLSLLRSIEGRAARGGPYWTAEIVTQTWYQAETGRIPISTQIATGLFNGGQFTPLLEADWALIQPYLEENERLFGIPMSELLTINDEERSPADVYRKVEVRPLTALA